MDKFNKKYTAYLVASIVMSVLFVAGIPGIIIFAGKVKALMIVSIVVVAFGFYATPILWTTTGGLGGLKKVLVAVEEQHVYTVTELSSVLSLDKKDVTERVKKLLAGFYLEGYTFDGETLTKVDRKKKFAANDNVYKCENCGAPMEEDGDKLVCPYCGSVRGKK